MNRFDSSYKLSANKIWNFISFIFVLFIFLLFLICAHNIENNSIKEQAKNLEYAIHNDVLYCYSVEGVYPPNLEYIETHYGLTYDKSRLYVDYIYIGSNIFPDITVIIK